MELLFQHREGRAIVRLVTPADVDALLEVFEQVAAEEGWQPGSQMRAYAGIAHHLAIRSGEVMAGGLQVVLPDADGHLPYQAVWPEIAPAPCAAEVTVLALKRAFRGHGGLFWPLCVELWRWCVAEAVETVVLEATPLMLERYRRVGWPLEVIGNLRVHWGEACFLCKMRVREVAGSLLARAIRSATSRALIHQAVRSSAPSGCAPPAALP